MTPSVLASIEAKLHVTTTIQKLYSLLFGCGKILDAGRKNTLITGNGRRQNVCPSPLNNQTLHHSCAPARLIIYRSFTREFLFLMLMKNLMCAFLFLLLRTTDRLNAVAVHHRESSQSCICQE